MVRSATRSSEKWWNAKGLGQKSNEGKQLEGGRCLSSPVVETSSQPCRDSYHGVWWSAS